MARRLSGIIVVGVFSVLTSLAVGVAPALATLYDLNLNNLGIAGSIGTVTTSLVGSSINVSVAMKPGFDMFGNTLTFGFNQVATEGALTISTLTPGYAVGCANCSPLVQYSTFGRFENNITDGVGAATSTC